jgi:hypothetical protein
MCCPIDGTFRLGCHLDEPKTPKHHAGRFQPGQSGNPGGRPKGLVKLRELLIEKYETRCVDGLNELLVDDDPRVRLETIKHIQSYLYGKPTQSVEMSGPEGAPVSISINRTVKP